MIGSPNYSTGQINWNKEIWWIPQPTFRWWRISWRAWSCGRKRVPAGTVYYYQRQETAYALLGSVSFLQVACRSSYLLSAIHDSMERKQRLFTPSGSCIHNPKTSNLVVFVYLLLDVGGPKRFPRWKPDEIGPVSSNFKTAFCSTASKPSFYVFAQNSILAGCLAQQSHSNGNGVRWKRFLLIKASSLCLYFLPISCIASVLTCPQTPCLQVVYIYYLRSSLYFLSG